MALLSRVAFCALVGILCISPLHADTPMPGDGLGLPSIPIATGTHMIGDGVGMLVQPGVVTLEPIPAGATIKQVIVYWSGFTNFLPGDFAIGINNGVDPPVNVGGTLIGGPTTFFFINGVPFDSWVYRADITALNLITPGTNTLTLFDLIFDGATNGASVVVIYDDNVSPPSELAIRDGQDLAFINFRAPLNGITDPQTFTYTPSAMNRFAKLHMVAGSVDGAASGGGPLRPNVVRVFLDGVLQNTFSNFFESSDGDEWDHLTVDIAVPANSTSMMVQCFSEDNLLTGALPASMNWCVTGLSIHPPLGEIGDYVWCDSNDDGIQDPGETGVPGVDVQLFEVGPDGVPNTADDVLVATQTTGVTGAYLFDNLPPGNYSVVVDAASALPKVPGSNCPEQVTVLGVDFGDQFLDADFCFLAPRGVIGDLVWCDEDNDGVPDLGEPPLPGVTVTLCGPGPDATLGTADDVVLGTETTDANGTYYLTGVSVGSYLVKVDPATAFPKVPGVCPTEITVSLPGGAGVVDADFCFVDPPSAIGDFVWCDLDNDTVQDPGEPGLPGVMVELCVAGLDGILATADDVTIAIDVTDASGTYLFDNLNPGTYLVKVDITTALPKVPGVDCPQGHIVPLAAGDSNLDADFCFVDPPGQIGDFVWCDLNDDGVPDAGEPGIAGVAVSLCTAGPDFVFGTADDVTVATDTTDAAGGYLFSGVAPGTYSVKVDEATALPKVPGTHCPPSILVPLPVGLGNLQADFCFIDPTTEIGSLVWCDDNNNGVQDPGEPGLPGVVVDLCAPGPDGVFDTADDILVATTMTDAAGAFLFTGITPGTYIVKIDLRTVGPKVPGGPCPPDMPITVTPGTDIDIEFCFVDPASIGDFVWCDLNDDGVQGVGEPGLAAVNVALCTAGPDSVFGTADDVTVAMETTDATGAYLFDELQPGTYDVKVDLASAAPKVPGTNCPPNFVITVAPGESNLSADFCFIDPGTQIGSLVWCDDNNNGVQDPGEPGLPGVIVRLCAPGPDGVFDTTDDILVAATTTDATGAFLFTGITPGTYIVKIDLSTVGPKVPGGPCPPDMPITVNPGDTDIDIEFCFVDPASIGDFVWCDLNDDGVQDAGEPGVAGVEVALCTAGPDGVFGTADDLTVAMETTDASGAYLFAGLEEGTYDVKVDASSALPKVPGTNCPPSFVISVVPGDSNLNADFCFVEPTGSIGDFVWCDHNDDGVQDPGEPGIAGVGVELCLPGIDGVFNTPDDVIAATTTTNASGVYLFDALSAATYRVKVDVASALPKLPGTHCPPHIVVALAMGESNLNADFCFIPANGSIGDFVWCDHNDDGVQDPGEPGIPGVGVELCLPGIDGVFGTADDVTVATATTDANGLYLFDDLTAATYRVKVDTVSALPKSPGTHCPQHIVVALAMGESNLSADFCFVPPFGSIGDFVWCDHNDDGVQDVGEPGIVGVGVELCLPGIDGVFGTVDDVVVATTTTDVNGEYLFGNLTPATYRVKVDVVSALPKLPGTHCPPHIVVPLAMGENNLNADFCFVQPTGSIGDFVWCDHNDDGVQDPGEPGILGVGVDLCMTGPDGVFGTPDDVVVATTTTDASGGYLFDGLDAATYRVKVDTASALPKLPGAHCPPHIVIPLAMGGTNLNADFCFTSPQSAIGDFVWCDLNDDGVQDPGEPGLAGVGVTLCTAGPDSVLGTADDVIVATTTTDAAGAYLFSNLVADTYDVKVDAASALPKIPGTNCPPNFVVALPPGGSSLNVDFCFVDPPSSIGDFVWCDLNDDGVQDVGEPGLPGVGVSLCTAGVDGIFLTADDVIVATTTTNALGAYLFDNLAGNTYSVKVDLTTALPKVPGTHCPPSFVVPLAPGASNLNADFCFIEPPGSIGDFVWCDLNDDGIQDAGEPGIAGVTVTLCQTGPDLVFGTADDVLVATAMTNAVGAYLFDGLAAATYQVKVDEATALPKQPGSCPPSLVIPLGVGEDNLAADFCFVEPPAQVGDFIWCDLNNDGVQDAGEPGLPGVGVTLCASGPDGVLGTADDETVATTTTDANGNYVFMDVAPGQYLLKVDLSSAAPKIPGGPCPPDVTVTLTPGEINVDGDFCFVDPASVGDFVWCDLNDDGIQDVGEPGLAGADVELCTAGPDGVSGTADDVTVATTTTDASGAYLFDSLLAATYTVKVELSTALPKLPGSHCPANFIVPLAAGDSFLDADFCFVDPSSIGDYVWCDFDDDGVQDPGETALAGVDVSLCTPGPDGVFGTADDVEVATTTTDASGSYLFANLAAATYTVKVDPSTAHPKLPGTNCPTSIEVPLAAGVDNLDVDFCFVDPGSIGDFVWCDLNDDGVQDIGEPGIAGVGVSLCTPGLDGVFGTVDDINVASTTTDVNGVYVFEGLATATYLVKVDAATALPKIPGTFCPTNFTVPLAAGAAYLGADFCFIDPPSQVGDFIWCDLNNDGVQDPGEPGLAGVDVTLCAPGPDGVFGTADDVTVATTTTDATGHYVFTGIAAGAYLLKVDLTSALPKVPGGGCPPEVMVTLTPGEINVDGDFCFVDPASIGDFVWCDTNDDGVQDVGEPGLPGVDVLLCVAGIDGVLNTPDDVVVATMTTDATGAYLFTALEPGDYLVKVDNATALPKVPGTNCPPQHLVALAAGDNFLNADFCFRDPPSQIGDFIWCDLNNDGVPDVGEPGLAGVTVTLCAAGPDGVFGTADDVTVATTVTDATGNYLFADIDAGAYLLKVDLASALPKVPGGGCPPELMITVVPGEINVDGDFCFVEPGSIGDFVWCDLNDDGVQDVGEPGLADVEVEICLPGVDGVFGTPDDVVVGTMTTDASGAYLFADLMPATYRVKVDESTALPKLPATHCPPNYVVPLAAGENFLEADFCFISPPGSIGDFVWCDLNDDGIQDVGEPGLAGVDVEVCLPGVDGVFGSPDDVVVARTATDASGGYLFADLEAGTYRVKVDAPTALPKIPGTHCPPNFVVALAVGQDFLDADFCFIEAPGSIGNSVWCDLNDDGVQDVGEPGLGGVDVQLCVAGPDGVFDTADDVTVATQTTDAAGVYLFTGFAADTYQVKIDVATALPKVPGTNCPPSHVVVLAMGDDFLEADFCFVDPPGAIGDYVWCDDNDDGVQDVGEPGIPGVDVELCLPGADGVFGTTDDIVVGTMTTDASGAYLFDGLAAATYQVKADATTALPKRPGTHCPIDHVVPLAPGQNFLDADFCFIEPPSAVGDFVWCDLNDDGVQDVGEPGLPGVEVLLCLPGIDGVFGTADDVTVATATTDATGAYQFDNLVAGTYQVKVELATALPKVPGTNCPPDFAVTLGVGDNNFDADFCFVDPPSSIGDYVWCDLNDDGVQDVGEPGLASVDVELCLPGLDGVFDTGDDVTVATMTTDASGAYLFDNLAAGSYLVKVDAASALPKVPGANCPADYLIALAAGERILDADFCFVEPPSSIGNLVWCDLNDDGVQDLGEPGLAGVDVSLCMPGADGVFGTADDVTVATVTTDASGGYLFDNLAAATYLVKVDAATALPKVPGTNCPSDYTVTLAAGDNSLDADFCFVDPPSSIGDFVWCDFNDDGVQDVGEPGLGGVDVSLCLPGADGIFGTPDDVVVAMQTTNAAGAYLFAPLTAGTYSVKVDAVTALPKVPGTNCPPHHIVSVAAGDANLNADFCFVDPPAGQIGDYVWCDIDDDGVQDPGEPPIAGVDIALCRAGADGLLGTADDVQHSLATTDASGGYLFTGLEAGDYLVKVDESTALPKVPGTNCPIELPITLGFNEVYLDADFCFREPPGQVGDTIFCDLDGNGVQDPGEPGLPGVTITLTCAGIDGILGTADDLVSTTMSDPAGSYLFTDVPPGLCAITVDTTQPSVQDKVPCIPVLPPIDLPPGGVDMDQDLCFVEPPVGQIGDFVWCDLDDDGVQDLGEPGLSGVTVELTSSGIDGVLGTADDVSTTTVTDATGSYLFTGLDPGEHTVAIVFVTALPKLPGTHCPLIYDVTLPPDASFFDADFCFVDEDCEECDGKVTFLSIQYTGTVAGANIVVEQDNNGAILFSGIVNPGETFSFMGADSNGTMGSKVFASINGGPDIEIHTSCSQPIGPGTTWGPFLVIAGTSLDGGPICPAGPCEAGKPCSLTMRYTGEDCSATTHSQDSNKVSCSGNPMFEPAVRILATDKDNPNAGNANVWFDGEVALNATFDIEAANAGEDKLKSQTHVYVYDLMGNLLQSIEFHTSCSQPLNFGDQFGSVVLEGFTEEGACTGSPPGGPDLCDAGKPCQLTLLYTGEDCSATSHNQDSNKVSCSGDPAFAPMVYILATDDDDPNANNANVWFSGNVDLGSTFDLSALMAGEDKLKSDTHVYVYDLMGNLLQSIEFHTSCSQPLALGDQFGSVQVVDFVAEGGCTGGPGSIGPDLCDAGKPCALVMEYTGADCSGTSHSQDPNKVDCAGNPNLEPSVHILATDEDNPNAADARVWFDGIVALNSTFEIRAFAAGEEKLKSDTHVHIFDLSGTLLQSIEFHTSCSQPLALGDVFGAVTLLGFSVQGSCVPGANDDQCMGDKPKVLTMRYVGDDCSASNFTMQASKVSCWGDPMGATPVHIRATDKSNPNAGNAKIWFDGLVHLNGTFAIDATNEGEDKLKKDTWIHIFDATGTNLLQEIKFKTDCKEPLVLGDQFGGVVLVGYVGENQTPNPVPQLPANMFHVAAPMNTPRYGHTSTTLADGRVLVVGGSDERFFTSLASAEVFDQTIPVNPAPAAGAGAFIDLDLVGNPMEMQNGGRVYHTATRLSDGTVAIIGGTSDILVADAISPAEVFDPVTRQFNPPGFAVNAPMINPRFRHTATLMPDGNVLIAGGQLSVLETVIDTNFPPGSPFFQFDIMTFPSTETVEVFNAATRMFDASVDITANPTELQSPRGRFGHAAATIAGFDNLLGTGDDVVLFGGGTQTQVALFAPQVKFPRTSGGLQLTSLEYFDPATGTVSVAPGVVLEPRVRGSVVNLGEFNPLSPAGVDGVANAVVFANGDDDGEFVLSTPSNTEVVITTFTGFGPAQGIQFFVQATPMNVELLPGAPGRTSAPLVTLPRNRIYDGLSHFGSWPLTAGGANATAAAVTVVEMVGFDGNEIQGGALFDAFYNWTNFGTGLSPSDTLPTAGPLNPPGIFGTWLNLDPIFPEDSFVGFGSAALADLVPLQALAMPKVFHAASVLPGPDGVLGTVDDRALFTGGGDDWLLSGGEPTAVSAEIYVQP